MTVHITIEGGNAADVRQQMRDLLGLDTEAPKDWRTAADWEKAGSSPAAAPAELKVLSEAATEILANARAVDEAPIVQSRGRGRPKKTEAVQAQVTAVENNSASAPAESTPAAEGAKVAAADATVTKSEPSAAVVLSFDEFKAALQDVQAAAPDNLRHVVAILNEFGYQKVKEVSPEHYGEIVVKARDLVKDAA